MKAASTETTKKTRGKSGTDRVHPTGAMLKFTWAWARTDESGRGVLCGFSSCRYRHAHAQNKFERATL